MIQAIYVKWIWKEMRIYNCQDLDFQCRGLFFVFRLWFCFSQNLETWFIHIHKFKLRKLYPNIYYSVVGDPFIYKTKIQIYMHKSILHLMLIILYYTHNYRRICFDSKEAAWICRNMSLWYIIAKKFTFIDIEVENLRLFQHLCGIVVAILKMATARNFSMSGINSGHHNLPTYQI
jgi:hypothetical protein